MRSLQVQRFYSNATIVVIVVVAIQALLFHDASLTSGFVWGEEPNNELYLPKTLTNEKFDRNLASENVELLPAERLWTIDLDKAFSADFYKEIRSEALFSLLDYDFLGEDKSSFFLLKAKNIWIDIFDGRYEEAEEKAEFELTEIVLKTNPWGNDGVHVDGATFHNLLQLRADALELQGDWDKAVAEYELIYGFNSKLPPENIEWIRLRRCYAMADDKSMFVSFCRILTSFHALSPANVDNVIQKGKALREHASSLEPVEQKWLPVGRTENGELDVEAYELYRLRDKCARVVFPKLHYATYPTDEFRGAKTMLLTRIAFGKFVEVMEEEYKRYSEFPDEYGDLPFSYVRIPDRELDSASAKDAMILLGKMKELPF